MIQLQVMAIDQRYEFGVSGQQLTNYLVLRLPNGKETRAVIDSDTASELLRVDAQESLTSEDSDPPAPAARGGSNPSLTNWESLPSEDMPPRMKAAFKALGIAPYISLEHLENTKREILESFSEDDWKELEESNEPLPTPIMEHPPAPAIGHVQWADGSPLTPSSSISRTVPTSSLGYPVLDDNKVDPWSAIGGDSDPDEDGVGSL